MDIDYSDITPSLLNRRQTPIVDSRRHLQIADCFIGNTGNTKQTEAFLFVFIVILEQLFKIDSN